MYKSMDKNRDQIVSFAETEEWIELVSDSLCRLYRAPIAAQIM